MARLALGLQTLPERLKVALALHLAPAAPTGQAIPQCGIAAQPTRRRPWACLLPRSPLLRCTATEI